MLKSCGKGNEHCPISLFHKRLKRLSDWDVPMIELFQVDCNGHIFDSSVLNASFTEQEMRGIILKLKCGEAAGIDWV